MEDPMHQSEVLTRVSHFCGWVYAIAWSVSFYGQITLNCRMKSVYGLSLDLVAYNVVGYLAYTIYSQIGYFDHHSGTGAVQPQDLAFNYHALTMGLIMAYQCLFYDRAGQKVSKFCKIGIAGMLIGLVIAFFTTTVTQTIENKHFHTVLFLGYMKIYVTTVKYVPQSYSNYIRKSTVGWSIVGVCLDFTGGVFSLAQMIVDAGNAGNWNLFTNHVFKFNITKFLLSVESIAFDLVFMTQHFILYRTSTTDIKGTEDKGLAAVFRPMKDTEEETVDTEGDTFEIEMASQNSVTPRKGSHE